MMFALKPELVSFVP